MRFKAFGLLSCLILAVTIVGCDSQSPAGDGNGTEGLFELSVVDAQSNPVSGLRVFVCYAFCDNAKNVREFPAIGASSLRSVELDYFYSEVEGDVVTLFWGTLTETNNAGFEVQTLSGNDWHAIAFVDGEGTTQVAQNYSYTREDLNPGAYTFRLKQIDFDGSFEYSPEVIAVVNLLVPLLIRAPYPNPFTSITQMKIAVDRDQHVEISVVDLSGAVVDTILDSRLEGNNTHTVTWNPELDNSILSDVYWLRATGETTEDSLLVAYTEDQYSPTGPSIQIDLGETNANGIVIVEDRTRLPSLFGVEPLTRTVAEGVEVGHISFTNDITVILRDNSGTVRRYQRLLNLEQNTFELVWQ